MSTRTADFEQPLSGWFTHLAWNIDLRLRGPFVLHSDERAPLRARLAALAAQLVREEGVHTAHALEMTVIPPLPGGPRCDLALLVHSTQPLTDALTERTTELGLTDPELALTARNTGRIGDTEARDGEILLNHFAGTHPKGAGEATAEATDAWKAVSTWYLEKLGVDNSTLLGYEPEAPFLIMNYARLPGGVMPFLAGQLLRPSFYGTVRRTLHDAGLTPFPVFARRVPRV